MLLAAVGAGVDEADVKSPNSACKPSRSEEAEDGMAGAAAAAGCLTVALAGAAGLLLPIRPSRSAEAEVEAGALLGEGAVTGRGGSVLATAGLCVAGVLIFRSKAANLLVTGAVGLLAGKTTFFATSAFALLILLAASSPWSNPIWE